MKRRYTDADKFEDEWYLSLSNDNRIVWEWILATCSNAGILKKNFKLLNFCCNTNLNEPGFKEIFSSRVIDCETFFFIPKFLRFQNPNGINSDKPAVKAIRKEIIEKGLISIIHKSLGNDYLIIAQSYKEKEQEREGEIGKGNGTGENKWFVIIGSERIYDIEAYAMQYFQPHFVSLHMKPVWAERHKAFHEYHGNKTYKNTEDFRSHYTAFILSKIPYKNDRPNNSRGSDAIITDKPTGYGKL